MLSTICLTVLAYAFRSPMKKFVRSVRVRRIRTRRAREHDKALTFLLWIETGDFAEAAESWEEMSGRQKRIVRSSIPLLATPKRLAGRKLTLIALEDMLAVIQRIKAERCLPMPARIVLVRRMVIDDACVPFGELCQLCKRLGIDTFPQELQQECRAHGFPLLMTTSHIHPAIRQVLTA